MNIYFDNIIYTWQKSGGISVVWTELLKRVKSSTLSYYLIEFQGCMSNHFRSTIQFPVDVILKRKCRLFWINRYIPVRVNENKPFIFHSSYYRTCNNKNAINIITIHDFTYEKYAKGFKRIIHSLVKYYAIKHSDYIICISNNTKKDLLNFVPSVNTNKIRVIYNGVSPEYTVLNDIFRFKNNKENSYIVFIGSRAKYKNFNIAVECSATLNLKLLIIGNPFSRSEEKYVRNMLKDHYILLSNVNNQDLNKIYNKAVALIYPSSYEGFGLPVLEAQRAGCPVIAMNSSSIPEIIGDKRLLVNDETIQSYIDKIKLVMIDSIRNEVIQLGLTNSMRFSWDLMSEQYISFYKEIQDGIINRTNNENFYNNSFL